jgi:hypothetical protein
MPRIRLLVDRDPDSPVVLMRTPDGSSAGVSNLRLYCRLLVGRDRKAHQAVVDTGAPTTVFPFLLWQRFQADVRWSPFVDGSASKLATLAGRSFRYRLGVVSVRLLGETQEPTLPPVDVVAQFEQLDPLNETPLDLKHTLVGLQLGPLEGRYLVVGPRRDLAERCEAWIADERPVDPLVLTSATL